MITRTHWWQHYIMVFQLLWLEWNLPHGPDRSLASPMTITALPRHVIQPLFRPSLSSRTHPCPTTCSNFCSPINLGITKTVSQRGWIRLPLEIWTSLTTPLEKLAICLIFSHQVMTDFWPSSVLHPLTTGHTLPPTHTRRQTCRQTDRQSQLRI